MALLHIWDNDSWDVRIWKKRDDATLGLAISGGAWGMVEQLDALVSAGEQYSRILFETHGYPGQLIMGDEGMDARWLRAVGGGRGWSSIAAPWCRLYFNGCNLAEGDAGWDFLRAAAEVFLSLNGGTCFGHTSVGFCNPFNGHVIHPWGDTRYVHMPASGLPAYG